MAGTIDTVAGNRPPPASGAATTAHRRGARVTAGGDGRRVAAGRAQGGPGRPWRCAAAVARRNAHPYSTPGRPSTNACVAAASRCTVWQSACPRRRCSSPGATGCRTTECAHRRGVRASTPGSGPRPPPGRASPAPVRRGDYRHRLAGACRRAGRVRRRRRRRRTGVAQSQWRRPRSQAAPLVSELGCAWPAWTRNQRCPFEAQQTSFTGRLGRALESASCTARSCPHRPPAPIANVARGELSCTALHTLPVPQAPLTSAAAAMSTCTRSGLPPSSRGRPRAEPRRPWARRCRGAAGAWRPRCRANARRRELRCDSAPCDPGRTAAARRKRGVPGGASLTRGRERQTPRHGAPFATRLVEVACTRAGSRTVAYPPSAVKLQVRRVARLLATARLPRSQLAQPSPRPLPPHPRLGHRPR